MEYPKEILVKDYFEIHNYYSNIYGKNRTIVLMQVGSFHEAYCSDVQGLDLVTLSQHLDIHLGKKNGNNPDNARMMGFPVYVTNNFIDKLIDMNYTVVLIDQVTEPPNPKRKVTSIISPATRIDNKTNKSSFLVSIVLDKVKDKSGSYQLCIGLSSYDMTTGEGSTYEASTKADDVLSGLDDAVRFLESFPPREIILENNLGEEMIANMKSDDIISYLNIEPGNTYNITKPNHKKIAYQTKLLETIYKIETNIDIMEYLGINMINFARLSLVLLLDYVQSHQPNLLSNLRIPTIFSSNKYLYLGNRALEQLDVTTKNTECNLFNIINFTKTSIGKRYLHAQLVMPLINNIELQKRYDMIQSITDGNHAEKIINYLEDIYDLDKLIRKLEINVICPSELYQLYMSFYQINKLIIYLKDNNLLGYFDVSKEICKQVDMIVKQIQSKYVLDKINSTNFNNFTEADYSIYNKGVHKEIDTLQESINVAQNFMSYLVKALEEHVDDKIRFNRKEKEKETDEENKSLITLKYNDRDGHYLLITNRRCEMLRKNLDKIKKLKVGTIELDPSDLEFNELPKSSNTKINCKKIQEISSNLVTYKLSMAKKMKELFKQDMITFLEKFGDCLYLTSKKIAFIDFINSGAICAKSYHYSKPIISMKEASYFKAKELRHPIVERISTDTTYKTHDIELGYETAQNGILLYGINSSGKSTLMKSIGLNIILAQIGYYTASTNFVFSPYSSLFTRICGNDNMYKGLSSFMVEMMELMAILKRNDNKTLMIGDEICRTTEERSGNIIVCYMLEKLSNSNTSFITATHLHKIASMESIKKLDRLKLKHLKITYDANNDMLIYDRHLSDGQGETFYGLQVAKYMMKDIMFNERTTEILKEYDNNVEKTSKYNSSIIMTCCEICKSKEKLESHHIVWQKDFKNDTASFHLQKNDMSNLVTLCMACHDNVDNNKIIVNGWIETSAGRKFDYIINEQTPEKKSKHPSELVKYIMESKGKDVNMIRISIKEKFDKKIASKTILNYWQ